MNMPNSFLTCLIAILPFGTALQADDRWIDLDENESYTPRHECSFVQAGNKFILFGGRESAQTLEMYDFATDTWTIGGQAPKEFNHFQATTFEGFVWICGAFKTNSFPRELAEENIWLYHPPTQKWIRGPEIPEDRRRGGAGLAIHDEKFYLIAGNTIGHDGGYVSWFDVYDPKANTWTRLEDAPHARDHFYAAVHDGKLYAAGGRLSGGAGGVFAPLVPQVDVFDFKTKTWSTLEADLPTPRAAPSVVAFQKQIVVLGGEGEEKGPAYKLVEAYSIAHKQWSRKADMNHARHGTQAIVSGEGIFIAAGSPKRGGGNQRNMEAYNENAPQGQAITASRLAVPKTLVITKGESASLELSCLGGTSGIFIQSITVSGANSNAFQLAADYDLRLIGQKDSLSVAIQNSSVDETDTATLEIEFNGGATETVLLKLVD